MCENNQFSEFTPSREVTAGEIADRARAFKMPTCVVDGNDVTQVWHAALEAIERARAGGGPSFIEAKTYRIRGHIEAESMFLGDGRYRSDAEIAEWEKKCPIDRLKVQLLDTKTASVREIEEIQSGIAAVVDEAAAYAEASDPADPGLAASLMFAGQVA